MQPGIHGRSEMVEPTANNRQKDLPRKHTVLETPRHIVPQYSSIKPSSLVVGRSSVWRLQIGAQRLPAR